MKKTPPQKLKFKWSDLFFENIFTSPSFFDPKDPGYQQRMRSKDKALLILIPMFIIFGLIAALLSDLFL